MIAPVLLFRLSPGGNDEPGTADHVQVHVPGSPQVPCNVTVVPSAFLYVVLYVPLAKGDVLVIVGAAGALMVMERLAVLDSGPAGSVPTCPVLASVTLAVKLHAVADHWEGVPVMAPLALFKDKPAGSEVPALQLPLPLALTTL